MKEDILKEVKRMLDFLQFAYEVEELKERLASDFSTFHRSHNTTAEDFLHYTREQRRFIDKGIATSVDYLKRYNNGETLRIEEYLGTIA